MENDIDRIRTELAARIAAIDVRTPHVRAHDLAVELGEIRRIAHHAGMQPAVTVARLLDSALARGEQGPLVHGWLGVLSDAVRCDRQDGPACDTYAAACSVRFTG